MPFLQVSRFEVGMSNLSMCLLIPHSHTC